MTNQIMIIFVIQLKEFSTMLPLQLLVQLKEHPNKKFIKNLVLSLYTLKDGSDACVYFIKLNLHNYHPIYMFLFLIVVITKTHKT